MKALVWLAIPVVAVVLAILWVMWATRTRPPVDVHDSLEERERFKAAFDRRSRRPVEGPGAGATPRPRAPQTAPRLVGCAHVAPRSHAGCRGDSRGGPRRPRRAAPGPVRRAEPGSDHRHPEHGRQDGADPHRGTRDLSDEGAPGPDHRLRARRSAAADGHRHGAARLARRLGGDRAAGAGLSPRRERRRGRAAERGGDDRVAGERDHRGTARARHPGHHPGDRGRALARLAGRGQAASGRRRARSRRQASDGRCPPARPHHRARAGRGGPHHRAARREAARDDGDHELPRRTGAPSSGSSRGTTPTTRSPSRSRCATSAARVQG